MRFMDFALVVALLCSAAAARAQNSVATLESIDRELRAEVQALEERSGRSVLLTDQGPIALDEVRSLVFREAKEPSMPAPAHVFFRNGDEVRGQIVKGDEDGFVLENELLGRFRVLLDEVAAIGFRLDKKAKQRFQREVLVGEPERDVVVLRTWVRRTGAVDRIGVDGVRGEWDGLGDASFRADNAYGVHLAPLGPPPDPPHGKAVVEVELQDGSRLSGALLALDRTGIRLARAGGDELKIGFEAIARLDFEQGRFAYLSDLDPVKVEERARLISVVFPHRRDRTVLGEPISVGGHRYRKGIGVHSYTRLVYDLGGKYERLHAVIGLDDSARLARTVTGTVVFQVLADGKPLLGENGWTARSDAAPRVIDLPVAGVERLELVADFGPSGDTLARGVWADAFLVRRGR